MKNFMTLFAMFLVFIQIQIALPQAIQSPPVSNLEQQLCKRNRYQALCISTLNFDPRSKTANLKGLASISVDATTKKVNEYLEYIISVSETIKDLEDLKRYKTCIDEYGIAARRFLPAALADLKAAKFSIAMSDMKSVLSAPDNCEAQFAGSSPLTGLNKAVHDIADMTADIIRYLFANN